HFCLPDLPVPKHCAHQETRSSEPHLGHGLPSIATLLIAAAPCVSKSVRRLAARSLCDAVMSAPDNLPALGDVLFVAALYLHLGPFAGYVRACAEEQVARSTAAKAAGGCEWRRDRGWASAAGSHHPRSQCDRLARSSGQS